MIGKAFSRSQAGQSHVHTRLGGKAAGIEALHFAESAHGGVQQHNVNVMMIFGRGRTESSESPSLQAPYLCIPAASRQGDVVSKMYAERRGEFFLMVRSSNGVWSAISSALGDSAAFAPRRFCSGFRIGAVSWQNFHAVESNPARNSPARIAKEVGSGELPLKKRSVPGRPSDTPLPEGCKCFLAPSFARFFWPLFHPSSRQRYSRCFSNGWILVGRGGMQLRRDGHRVQFCGPKAGMPVAMKGRRL